MGGVNVRQGQSADATEHKERGLGHTLRLNLRLFADKIQPRVPRASYWHFDINSGSGHNAMVNVTGSPLVFLNEATNAEVPYRAYFVDKDKTATEELSLRIAGARNVSVVCSDNRCFLRTVPELIRKSGERPEWAVGSILVDPNSPSGIPVEELTELLRACPRLDTIINLPSVHMRRIYGAAKSYEAQADEIAAAKQRKHLILPVDVPKRFPRSHWHVRKPVENRNGFALFVGRNVPMGDWKREGFYDASSPDGKELLEFLSYTGRTLFEDRQLSLFGARR